MAEEPGILGNLPRSRPGRRSARRDAGARSPKRSGQPAKPKGRVASAGTAGGGRPAGAGTAEQRGHARGARPASDGASSARSRADARHDPADEEETQTPANLVAGAARAAGGAASAGVRVASRLTAEALRRLPRP